MMPHAYSISSSLPLVRRDSAVVDVLAVAGAVMLGAWIRVPLPFSPVPVTLQTFPVLMAGFLVGPSRAMAGLSLYMALGWAGAPVFASAFGPTLGYLAAFVFVPVLTARCTRPAAGIAAGTMLIYTCGALWLALWLDCSLEQAFLIGVVPFVPGDVLKAIAAHALVRRWTREDAI
jgi:biotin transport system substrate-specific component